MTHKDRMRKSDRKAVETQQESEFQVYDRGQTKVLPFLAKTERQQQVFNAVLGSPMTIAVGPAGTGKSYAAAAAAIKLLIQKEVQKVIVTRNPVPTGYTTGLKPGDTNEKLASWLSPIMDNLRQCCENDSGTFGFYKYLTDKGMIEMKEMESLKGTTFSDCVVIIEESQECDAEVLDMLCTRAGENVHVYFDGDLKQANKRLRGSQDFQRFVEDVKCMNAMVERGEFMDVQFDGETEDDWRSLTVPVIEFDKADCIRSGITRWMLEMKDAVSDR